MPETAILNKTPGWDDQIDDDISPDYGFANKRPLTRVTAKAPFGQPDSRETSNAGYTMQLTWLNRSFACVQRVKHFREQYEDGYFTIIDHDGGGRHYVGRFTGELPLLQPGNDSYDLRDITFEEFPGAPMLQYPGNWERDSIYLKAFKDSGRQQLATSGTWTETDLPGYRALTSSGTANDFATMEYRGYGFELWLQTGPAYGQVEVSLDGTVLQPTLDLYSADTVQPAKVYSHGLVPHDIHRVKVRVLGAKNAASTSTAVTWCKLQVMR